MNPKEIEQLRNKVLQSLPEEKREAWLELNEKYERIIQEDPTTDGFDLERHKEQLISVMNEMDTVAGIKRGSPEKGKEFSSLKIMAAGLLGGFLLVIWLLIER
jgi:hypothetical protein